MLENVEKFHYVKEHIGKFLNTFSKVLENSTAYVGRNWKVPLYKLESVGKFHADTGMYRKCSLPV
jgi:hypothetical protein